MSLITPAGQFDSLPGPQEHPGKAEAPDNQGATMTSTDSYKPKQEQVLTAITHGLKHEEETGAKAREDAAQAMTTHRVGSLWGQGNNFVAIARAELAARLLRQVETASTYSPEKHWTMTRNAVEEERERLTESLLNGWLDASSTSSLSNAFTDVERQAAQQFVRALQSYRAMLDQAERPTAEEEA